MAFFLISSAASLSSDFFFPLAEKLSSFTRKVRKSLFFFKLGGRLITSEKLVIVYLFQHIQY